MWVMWMFPTDLCAYVVYGCVYFLCLCVCVHCPPFPPLLPLLFSYPEHRDMNRTILPVRTWWWIQSATIHDVPLEWLIRWALYFNVVIAIMWVMGACVCVCLCVCVCHQGDYKDKDRSLHTMLLLFWDVIAISSDIKAFDMTRSFLPEWFPSPPSSTLDGNNICPPCLILYTHHSHKNMLLTHTIQVCTLVYKNIHTCTHMHRCIHTHTNTLCSLLLPSSSSTLSSSPAPASISRCAPLQNSNELTLTLHQPCFRHY